MFITDLDGTLLNSNEDISRENIMAIKRLADMGIPFTVFTGREYHTAMPYIDKLKINAPVVFHNGALILDGDGSVIRKNMIESEKSVAIIEEAYRNLVNVVVYSDFLELPDMSTENDPDHLTPYTPYLMSQKKRISFVDNMIETIKRREGVAHIALTGYETNLKNVFDFVQKNYGDSVSSSYSSLMDDWGFHSYYWDRYYGKAKLEEEFGSELDRWGLMYLSGPDVSKGAALDTVLERYSIKPEETAFIGDHYNDIPLMKKVGLPIAVSNASDEVKKHCRLVVGSNNEHGVAQAINKVFFDNDEV